MPSIGKITGLYQSIIFQRPSLGIISNIFNNIEYSKKKVPELKNEKIEFNKNITAKNIF